MGIKCLFTYFTSSDTAGIAGGRLRNGAGSDRHGAAPLDMSYFFLLNCSSSVEPLSAPTEVSPPEINSITRSK